MSTNSSSSNDTLHVSANINLLFFFGMDCISYTSNFIIFATFNITNVFLVLPLCIFILHHGLQLWRQSHSTSLAAMSHSDSFTYHMVAMEIIGVLACFINLFAIYTDHFIELIVGIFFISFTYFGEMFFHILTCIERYLAVVYPITYLSLRKERGIRLRNICIFCVWVFSLLFLCFLMDTADLFSIVNFFMLILSLLIVTFCSVSVLCVLIRPGPGQQGGRRERVDQSKRRAFYTIVTILGILLLRLLWELIRAILNASENSFNCEMMLWTFWLCIPSRLALPLLFILTKEKLKRKCIFCWLCRN